MKTTLIALAYLTILATTTIAAAKDTLTPKEYLYKGQQLTSNNGLFNLLMRDDGVLALYQAGKGQIWSASKNSSGCKVADYAHFNYNLHLYGRYEKDRSGECSRWATNANLTPNYKFPTSNLRTYLKLQDDGNIVITSTDAPWNSGTSGTIVPNKQNIVILPGTTINLGTEYIIGQYKLTFQNDGNLVIYNGTKPLWASWTQNKRASKAIMQHDGNFVIYDLNNNALWHTKTNGKQGAYLAFQADGNMVIYQPLAVWARWGVALDKPKTIIYPNNQFGPINIPIWSW